jgi:hypothetical protein
LIYVSYWGHECVVKVLLETGRVDLDDTGARKNNPIEWLYKLRLFVSKILLTDRLLM